MRRALLALWLVASAVGLYVLGASLYSPVTHFGSPASLLIIALWLVGIAPASLSLWFRVRRNREREVVEAALKTWMKGAGGGALVADAIELALDDEDEESLRRLLDALGRGAPPQLAPTLQPFMKAAHEWLSDDGGHSSRDEHLDRLKDSARPLLPVLQKR